MDPALALLNTDYFVTNQFTLVRCAKEIAELEQLFKSS